MKCNFKSCLRDPKLSPCCLTLYRNGNKFLLRQQFKKITPKPLKNLYFHVNYLTGNGKDDDCYQKGYRLNKSNLQLENMYNTYINMISTIESRHSLSQSYTLSYSLIFLIFDEHNKITNFSQLFLKYVIKNPTLLIPSPQVDGYDGDTTIINGDHYEDILPLNEFVRLVTKLLNTTNNKSQIFTYLDPRLEIMPFTTLLSATFENIHNLITIKNGNIFNESYISFDKPDIISSSVVFNSQSSTMFSKLFTPNTSWGCIYKFINLTIWSNLTYNMCTMLIDEDSFGYSYGSIGQQMIRRNNEIIHQDNSKLSFLRNINGEYDFMTIYKVNKTDTVSVTHNYHPCFIDTNTYVYLFNYPYIN